MNRAWIVPIAGIFALAGCQNKQKSSASVDDVNNPMTHYVDNLMDDKSRAAGAVDKYNKSVHELETAGQEAGAQ